MKIKKNKILFNQESDQQGSCCILSFPFWTFGSLEGPSWHTHDNIILLTIFSSLSYFQNFVRHFKIILYHLCVLNWGTSIIIRMVFGKQRAFHWRSMMFHFPFALWGIKGPVMGGSWRYHSAIINLLAICPISLLIIFIVDYHAYLVYHYNYVYHVYLTRGYAWSL